MATATQALKNFIDGESVEAAEGRTDAVLNPATGEEIAQAPSSTQADVDRAVKAARAAFEGWGNTTPGERSLALIRIADALEANADEIPAAADQLRFFAGAARNLEGKAAGEYLEGYTSFVRREPMITSLPSGSCTRAIRSPHGWSLGSSTIATPAARSRSTAVSQSSAYTQSVIRP